MYRQGLNRWISGLFLLCVVLSSGTLRLEAQSLCLFCATTNDYGSCIVSTPIEYPGQSPSSAVVVPVGDGELLYVTDFDSGLVYAFAPTGGTDIVDLQASFATPGSPNLVSGVTYNPNTLLMYWAVHAAPSSSSSALPTNPRLLRSAPDLSTRDPFTSGVEIDMIGLANQLGFSRVGKLGGIACHVARNTFWGVDVVNDVVFEFNFSGQPVVENDEVVHFPLPRSRVDRPSYGNSLSYVSQGGADYFDITVGDLTDGSVTRVERVFASSGEKNGLSFEIGDPTGLYYDVDPVLGPHGFLTGVQEWPDACGEGENLQVLLSIGGFGDTPKIFFVSTDTPEETTRGLASLECSADGNNVDLAWKFFEDLESLSIKRVDLQVGEETPVITLPDPDDPPGSLVAAGAYTARDERISDGAYEYVAIATTSTGVTLPERRCLVNVGRGSVLGAVSYVDSSAADGSQNPFAMTYVDSEDRLVVADRLSGFAKSYTRDLEHRSTFQDPFANLPTFQDAKVLGLAWSSTSSELIWLVEQSLSYFLQRTTIQTGDDGEISGVVSVGSRVRARTPFNLLRQPMLGDLAYDASSDQLWTVDRLNGVAYSLRPDGSLAGHSFEMQIPNPFPGSSLVSGGISVAESSTSNVILDWIVGPPSAETATQLARLSYFRSVDDDGLEEINVPGTEEFRFDLRAGVGSAIFGGHVGVESDEESHLYVVALDTLEIVKLEGSAGISGKKFVRGDVNFDRVTDISDPSFLLSYLFLQGKEPDCRDAGDINDDELLDISDPIGLFNYLFLGHAPPKEPFQECGFDLGAELTCERSNCPGG